jgi:hypothetical protein
MKKIVEKDPEYTGIEFETEEELFDYFENFEWAGTVLDVHQPPLIDRNSQKIRVTICNMLRRCSWIIQNHVTFENDELKKETMYLLERSFLFGKKMDARLRMYKSNFDEDWYEKEKKVYDQFLDQLDKHENM